MGPGQGLLAEAGRQHCIGHHPCPSGELEGTTGTSVFKMTGRGANPAAADTESTSSQYLSGST